MKTTITISKELKENIENLGRDEESFEDILERMYTFTKRNLLLEYLYDETHCIPIKEAQRQLAKYKQTNSENT